MPAWKRATLLRAHHRDARGRVTPVGVVQRDDVLGEQRLHARDVLLGERSHEAAQDLERLLGERRFGGTPPRVVVGQRRARAVQAATRTFASDRSSAAAVSAPLYSNTSRRSSTARCAGESASSASRNANETLSSSS